MLAAMVPSRWLCVRQAAALAASFAVLPAVLPAALTAGCASKAGPAASVTPEEPVVAVPAPGELPETETASLASAEAALAAGEAASSTHPTAVPE